MVKFSNKLNMLVLSICKKIDMRQITVLTLVLLFGHSVHAQSITGTYHSKRISLFSRGFAQIFENTLHAIGSSLEIKPDSTFHLITCGSIIDGYWRINGRQLILTDTANRFRIDSLNRTGYKGMFPENMLNKSPFIFKIKKHGLKQKTKSEDSNRNIVDYLVKVGGNKLKVGGNK